MIFSAFLGAFFSAGSDSSATPNLYWHKMLSVRLGASRVLIIYFRPLVLYHPQSFDCWSVTSVMAISHRTGHKKVKNEPGYLCLR